MGKEWEVSPLASPPHNHLLRDQNRVVRLQRNHGDRFLRQIMLGAVGVPHQIHPSQASKLGGSPGGLDCIHDRRAFFQHHRTRCLNMASHRDFEGLLGSSHSWSRFCSFHLQDRGPLGPFHASRPIPGQSGRIRGRLALMKSNSTKQGRASEAHSCNDREVHPPPPIAHKLCTTKQNLPVSIHPVTNRHKPAPFPDSGGFPERFDPCWAVSRWPSGLRPEHLFISHK